MRRGAASRWSVGGLVTAALLAAVPAGAVEVKLRAASHPDHARIVFDWPKKVTFQADAKDNRLVVVFGEPIETNFGPAVKALGEYVIGGRVRPDRRSVEFDLKQPVTASGFYSGNSIAVDLRPAAAKPPAASSAGASPPVAPPAAAVAGSGGGETTAQPPPPPSSAEPPPSPPSSSAQPAKPPIAAVAVAVPVRAADHPEFSRLVFDWPVSAGVRLEREGRTVKAIFDRPGRADLTSARKTRLRNVEGLADGGDSGPLVVQFNAPETAEVREGRSGKSIILDVLNAGTRKTPATSPQSNPPPSATEVAGRPQTVVSGGVSTTSANAAAAEPPVAGHGAPVPASAAGGHGAPAPASPVPAAAGHGAETAPAIETPDAHPATPPGPAAAKDATVPALVFDTGGPAAAAVFQRAGRLYVVFDRPLPIGAGKIQGKGTEGLGDIEPVPATGGSVYRTRIGPFIWPKVTRKNNVWQISPLTRLAAPPGGGVKVTPDPDFMLGGRLVVRTPDAAALVQFADPDVGDRLLVVPLSNPGDAVFEQRSYPDVELLPSFQGVAIRPISDDVTIRPVREGMEISAAGGLRLSPTSDLGLASGESPADASPAAAGGRGEAAAHGAEPAAHGAAPAVHGAPAAGERAAPGQPAPRRLLSISDWQHGGLEHFTDSRQELQQAIADAPDELRSKVALDLVKFYLSYGFGQEALGILQALTASDTDLAGWPDYQALNGLALYLSADFGNAEKALSIPQLANNPEIGLWRAAIAAEKHDWPAAAKGFQTGAVYLAGYPEPLLSRLSLLAAEAALKADDAGNAQRLIDRVVSRGGTEADERPAIQFMRGELYRANDDPERAREQFKLAYESSDRYYRARAGLALVNLELAEGLVSPASAISTLTGLTYAWRGDELEIAIRKRLGAVQVAAGQYYDGFNTMKETVGILGDTPAAEEITKEMEQTFAGLFKEGGTKLSILEQLKLFNDFKELTPPGEQGDAIVRYLAERLVDIDLLERAAGLYDYQVRNRLSGLEKARIGTRLASIRLLDGKPAEAIQALQDSNVSGIPYDLAQERNTMFAKALAEQGRTDEAIQLLAKDDSRPADLLRIDIAWRNQKWDDAALALAKVIGPPPSEGKQIDPATLQLVLNRAVALALGGDATGLNVLRKDFGPAMTAGPDADAFRVLTRPEQATGLIDVNTIRSRVAEVDVFKNFLKGYRDSKTQTKTTDQSKPSDSPPDAGTKPPAPAG